MFAFTIPALRSLWRHDLVIIMAILVPFTYWKLDTIYPRRLSHYAISVYRYLMFKHSIIISNPNLSVLDIWVRLTLKYAQFSKIIFFFISVLFSAQYFVLFYISWVSFSRFIFAYACFRLVTSVVLIFHSFSSRAFLCYCFAFVNNIWELIIKLEFSFFYK